MLFRQSWGFKHVRLLLFLLLTSAYMLVFFHRMAPGAISGELMDVFDITGARLGSLAATYFLVYSLMQIPSGVLADVFGMRISMITGNLAAGIGSCLFGLADSYAMASAGRLLVGLGVSVIFISIMKFNSQWFSARRFALMAGIVGLTGNMGAVLASGPLTLILRSVSWRTVFVAAGIISLSISVISMLFVRNTPADYGFQSPEHSAGDISDRQGGHWLSDLFAVARNPFIWPGFWSNFGIIGGAYTFMGLWGIPFLHEARGMSKGEAASCVTVMLIMSAFGALVSGWISDFIGRRKPVLISSNILYTITFAVVCFCDLKASLMAYILFGLLGLFSTGCVLTLTCAKEVAHPSRAGIATSIVNTGTFTGVLVLQPLFGWVLDQMWNGSFSAGVRTYSLTSYSYAMMLFLFYACIGVIAAFFIRETYCRHIHSLSNAEAERISIEG